MNENELKKDETIEEMAAWIRQVGKCMKETGFDVYKTDVRKLHPECFDKNLFSNEFEYLLYGENWTWWNPYSEAEEIYEAGLRLVPTKNEPNGQFLDWWGTGLVLKDVQE